MYKEKFQVDKTISHSVYIIKLHAVYLYIFFKKTYLEIFLNISPSLPSIPGPIWLGVVTPDIFLPMGQIELFDI